MTENKSDKKHRFVYAVIEKGTGSEARTFWQKCGIAYVNRDQSINLYLDTLPLNGKLQIREDDRRWASRGPAGESPEPPSTGSLDLGVNFQ